LANRRAADSSHGVRPPFVDLSIKLDADDLTDDSINDYFDDNDYINVVFFEMINRGACDAPGF
jgi:hypothetical protein